ncbi:TlpA disulfide reductase family protein [Edaphobacter flagellatus]|uniref:TlpA disulfide reductase family protein n=1 Tax=Edaphobacter flagellatus TaxID=1933044 RepID=UPI0021B3BAEB|nr:TlpA disulfide reductase family protein [Edaphobacter flagellatus]
MNPFFGKLLAGSLLLSASSLVFAAGSVPITGTWEGAATVRGQQVPLRLHISGSLSNLKAALINGTEQAPASAATFKDGKLLVTFNYFARSLEATFDGSQLSGTFGLISPGTPAHPNAPRVPVSLHPAAASTTPASGPDIHGDWEIAVSSSKGESAWQLRINPTKQPTVVHAVIQRIDGDTGSLYGSWDGHQYLISHFNAAGPALYSLVPQQDGTLLVSNLLAPESQKAQARDLVARRPSDARKQNLSAPTDSTQQTRVKDPSVPFAFSFPDLSGHQVSNTDPEFTGKVVIVAIGGSWCPNCHDEAPFLESLYKKFHTRGLEIVNLSFEEEDQLQNPTRLRAFIQRYGLTYPVLIAGTPDQLNEKVPQGDHLNCWPTSFILGRDGRVKEVHAGFAGPANPAGHQALENEVTETIEKLLALPPATQKASN